MKTLKVRLEKTSRTDLVCIACGQFRTEFAIMTAESSSEAGVHRECIGRVHVRRAASPEGEASTEGETDANAT
jgi:hypothetical protein